MRSLAWLIETVNQKVGDWSSLLYLVVFVVTVYNVALRYFFDSPPVWALELVIALAAIHYAIAGAAAIKNDAHVRIDVIYRLLPTRLQTLMSILAQCITLIFLAIILYYGSQQAWTSYLTGETTGAGWNSHAPIYMKAAIPIGAALMILQTIVGLARSVQEAVHAR